MKSRKISIIALALCTLVVSYVHANKKTNPPAETPKENDALMEAAKNSDFAEVRRLIEAGADVSASTDYGTTVLMIAEKYGSADVIAPLKAAGAKTEE